MTFYPYDLKKSQAEITVAVLFNMLLFFHRRNFRENTVHM